MSESTLGAYNWGETGLQVGEIHEAEDEGKKGKVVEELVKEVDDEGGKEVLGQVLTGDVQMVWLVHRYDEEEHVLSTGINGSGQ